MDDHDPSWTIESAQANLSDVIDQARVRPQTIICDGKPDVVVVSAAAWESRAKRRGTLAEFMRNSPLADCDLDLERVRDAPRDISF